MQTLSGHKGSVVCCKVLRNYVVSSGYDKIIRIWNAESGILLHSMVGHDHIVSSFDISLNETDLDDVLIVSGSWDRTLCIWRFPSKGGIVRQASITNISAKSNTSDEPSTFLMNRLHGHKNRIKCVRAIPLKTEVNNQSPVEIPRDHFAVSGSDDGMILVWNVSQGTLLHTLKGHSHFILQLVVYSINVIQPEMESVLKGCCLASYSSDRTIRLWNLSSGEQTSMLSVTDVTSTVNDESDVTVSNMTLAYLSESTLMQLPLYVTARSKNTPVVSAVSEGRVVPVLVISDSANNLSLIDLQGSGRLLLHIPCRPDSELTSHTAAAAATNKRIVSITVASMPNDVSGVCRVLYLTDRGEVGCVNLFEPGVKVGAIKHSLSSAVSLVSAMTSNTSSKSKKNKSNDSGDGNTFHHLSFGHHSAVGVTPTNTNKLGITGYVAMCGDEGTLRVHSYASLMRFLDTAALVATATTTKAATPHSSADSVSTSDSFNNSIVTVRLPLLVPAPPKGKLVGPSKTPTHVTTKNKQYFTHEDEVSLSEHSLVSAYDAQILHGGVDFEELSDGGGDYAPQVIDAQQEDGQSFWKSLVGNANYGFNRVKFNGGRRTSNSSQKTAFNAHPQSELNSKKVGDAGGGGTGMVGSTSLSALKQHQPPMQQAQPQQHQSTDASSSGANKRQKKMMNGGNGVKSVPDHLPQVNNRSMQHSHSTSNAAPAVVLMNFKAVAGTICYVDEYPVGNSHRRAALHDDNASVTSISTTQHKGGGYNAAAYSHHNNQHHHHQQQMQMIQQQHGKAYPETRSKAPVMMQSAQSNHHQTNGGGGNGHSSSMSGHSVGGSGRKASGGRVLLPMIRGVV